MANLVGNTYRTWDAGVMDLVVQDGLYETEDGRVRLKMPGFRVSVTQTSLVHVEVELTA